MGELLKRLFQRIVSKFKNYSNQAFKEQAKSSAAERMENSNSPLNGTHAVNGNQTISFDSNAREAR